MKPHDHQLFAEVMADVKAFYGQEPMPDKVLEIYWDKLKPFSVGQLQIACTTIMQNYKVRWPGDFPTAFEFYEAMPNHLVL